jgi:cytochrome P450/NADPH-cytochrome P450 reductase
VDIFRLADASTLLLAHERLEKPPAVRETLARLHQEAVGCSAEEATGWLADMEKQGRLVSDVFT